MKVFLILAVLVVISLIGTSQTPNYFENDPVWKIRASFPSDADGYNYLSYILGDTLISDTAYYKLYNDYYDSTSSLVYLIRQEDQKVYRRYPYSNNNEEELIDDFSVQPGEFYIKTGQLVTENDIDSILINGFYHKVLFNQFIEGIGYHYPIFEPITPISPPDLSILCYGKNGENAAIEGETLPNNNWIDEHSTCDLTLSLSDNIHEELSSHRIKLYPNPSKHGVTVALSKSSSYTEWKIQNPRGEIISQGHFISQSKTIDISKIEAGLYFISIIHGSSTCIKRLTVE
ncbi:MAG: T9SS type A sorting domain-containing protein [Flavobacteriales bacterium]